MNAEEIKKAREILATFIASPTLPQFIWFGNAAVTGWPKALDEVERLQSNRHVQYVEAENQKLRAALEKLRDGPGNKMAAWKLTWAHEFAAKALK